MVVIGEGEPGDAPLLFVGEKIGRGFGPEVDVAVDPLDGDAAMWVMGKTPKGQGWKLDLDYKGDAKNWLEVDDV